MKLHIISDLHLEFGKFDCPDVGADYTILAGDIGVGTAGVSWAKSLKRRNCLYVAGNHEYYKHQIPRLTEDLLKDTHLDGEHCHFMEQSWIMTYFPDDGGPALFRFLGATLWTDLVFDGQDISQQAGWRMNDYHVIKDSDGNRLSPEWTRNKHRETVNWLLDELNKPFDGKTVVITHHAPSLKSCRPGYEDDIITGAYCTNLEPMMDKVDLWIHGHTHIHTDYMVGNCRVVSNARGYVNPNGTSTPDSVKNFDPHFVVEI